jgi:hypothetical protein
MKLRTLLFAAALSAAVPNATFANPVSFKDGWGIMPTYAPDWSDLDFNYSLTNKDAIGVSNFYREGSDSTSDFVIARYNRLISRWNELDSQANVYGSMGVGGRHDSKHDDSIAVYGSLEADYETRRVYTLLGLETLQSPEGVASNRIRYRAGIAPYLAPFESLQTWIIAQVDYMPEMDDEVTVTPLLRFFLNNYALEVGVSLDGKPFLGAMAHF